MKTRRFLEFGPFRLDCESSLLLRQDELIPLPPKTLEVLVALISSSGRTLTRDELMTAVWGDATVEEGNLTQAIFVLRKALGDSAQEPQYIVTIPRRGYRFGAAVREVLEAETAATPEVAVKPVEEPAPLLPARGADPRRFPAWPVAAAAVAVLLAGAGYWLHLRAKPAGAIQSVAVLPFVNLSQRPEQEYLSDGLTEEIINALAVRPGLKVVARTSVFQFKGKNADIRSIGTALGVETVLEGSVRIEGTRLRITAQLNSVRDGFHFWSRTWDRTLGDVFEVEQEIARNVAEAMGQPNSVPPGRLKPLTRNWEAHDFYLQGHHHKNNLTVGMLPRAVAAFERALELDPAFAAAHAHIGQAYIWAMQQGKVSSAKALPEVKRRAEQALALDPDLALAHALHGDVSFFGEWDFDAAERSYRRAIEFNPADAATRHEFTHFLLAMGRFEEAEAEARRIVDLDPVSVEALTHLELHFFMVHDTPRAVAAAERAQAVDPGNSTILMFLQGVHELDKQYRKAIETAAKRKEVDRRTIAEVEAAFQARGAAGYWEAWHQARLREPREDSGRAWEMAQFHTRMGHPDQALKWLARAVDLRYVNAVYLGVAPEFEPLRPYPEFQRLVRRIGLPTR